MDERAQGRGWAVSRREAEVLDLLGDQLTHEEIATRLFISVRTVESHVASLRHKLETSDHRALVRLAVTRRQVNLAHRPPGALPAPLSSFVGRHQERSMLADALGTARLVTVIGPGGIGKTRLVIATAADAAPRYRHGVAYLDLVPVTEPDRIAGALASAVGVGEPGNRTHEEALVDVLAGREMLLLFDNCEHIVNAIATLAERVLRDCPDVTVLITSRTRLAVPHERVALIGGLGVEPEGGGDTCDAVALFVERAQAAGAAITSDDRPRVLDICRALDGAALAIELAAARVATLGLDGVERGLVDHDSLLVGGARLHPRHRSVRDTLDWSYQLLDATDQCVLRRISTFQAPFRAEDARTVAGYEPLSAPSVDASLGRLVEHSLLVVLPSAPGVRYRALETVRQHSAAKLLAADDHVAYHHHFVWCQDRAAALRDMDRDRRYADEIDAVVDDMHAAIRWATASGRADAHGLAARLADLLFQRGHTTDAQQEYEHAARLSDDPAAIAIIVEAAAAVAKCRVAGEEALRLERAAAIVALAAGDPGTATACLARGSQMITRFAGMFGDPPSHDLAQTLLVEARRHAPGDARSRAAVLAAEASADDHLSMADATRIADHVFKDGDPNMASAALDTLTGREVIAGDPVAAANTARRRIELLAGLPTTPSYALELKDALHNGVFTALGAGDLSGAQALASEHARLPFLREEAHLAVEELIAPGALSGNWTDALEASNVLLDGWRRTGERVASGRGLHPAAAALIHGLRGDDLARNEWIDVLTRMQGHDSAPRPTGYAELFNAIVLLHRGHFATALATLDGYPTDVFYAQVFRQWHAALHAEAAVLAGDSRGATLVDAARSATAGNPVATALAARASALLTGQDGELLEAAEQFDRAHCPYQAARTRVFAGADAARAGAEALARLGASPIPL